MKITDDQLRTILLGTGLIDPDKLDEEYKIAKEAKRPLAKVLVDRDVIPDDALGQIVADAIQMPYVVLSKIAIVDEVLKVVPEVEAKKQRLIAFSRDANGIKVAMSDPSNTEVVDFLSKKTGEKIAVYFTTDKEIDRALRLYQKDLQKTFDELLKEQVDEHGKAVKKETSVTKIVDLLIEYAYVNRTSDIHIEPEEEDSLVRFRIDGVLHDILRLPRELHDQVTTRIKVMSRLRTDEHLSAQDGKLQVKLEEEDLDVRVSIVPVVEGEKVVMRLLSSKSRQYSLNDLGMNSTDLEKVKKGFTKPYGMVLSTGPTGSGKTTSIYAILKILNIRDKNISTIEDPVEYEIQGLNQIQVNVKTNLTFADGLRSILRQDPDIIFVGEIRDEETADIAVNAAMTGHLVLSTLHTNDAATTLPRLMDMGIEPFLVASTVNVIVGQRLIRKICERCRVSTTYQTKDLLYYLPKEIVKKHFGDKEELRFYKGKGCDVCHGSGYGGRVGIFEVLEVTESVRDLIVAKADADVIAQKAVEEGMTTMIDDGLMKVISGVTTVEEVFRAAKA